LSERRQKRSNLGLALTSTMRGVSPEAMMNSKNANPAAEEKARSRESKSLALAVAQRAIAEGLADALTLARRAPSCHDSDLR
jgi:hypothetical protein